MSGTMLTGNFDAMSAALQVAVGEHRPSAGDRRLLFRVRRGGLDICAIGSQAMALDLCRVSPPPLRDDCENEPFARKD